LATDFALPELGENVASGDVLRVLVKAGDTIEKDQPVLELETDKATIEVPSSVAGRITTVNVKAGDKVKVGQSILTVDEAHADRQPASAAPVTAATEQTRADIRAADSSPTTTAMTSSPTPTQEQDAAPVRQAASRKVVDISRGARQAPSTDGPAAPASPSVRRKARELGVDINQVSGTGPDGRISIDDVKAYTKRVVTGGGALGTGTTAATEPLPDFTRWGEVERQPMKGIRRKTAERLSAAWISIPHVTQHDVADITSLEDARRKYQKQVEAAGGALTLTAVAVKIAAAALNVFPQFNSSIDLAANEIIYKKFVNIGVAVDTERGLLVPVIRDADHKNLTEIAIELTQLSEKARSGKIALNEMQGGCFSISNLGGIGGTSFTPIVNPPEVAILGMSRAAFQPVYEKDTGQFVARQRLPLSLSYDHRVIDGADGIRFMRWIVEAFEQPFMLALLG
jgi:pyruvate dehydrogenase E2 component (dihydrolipoamide acetyltransferase)